ncbi:hypothetical protein PGT21_020072 [Puccinia graminis f. sp. tritici]|uniref:Uncharacterized protein n=1 Tax=Puccinia graminis f. sp. tritici TaxID=56615 RepID=A0A5B0LWS0_PUCGR|nr:hypothetical protein PGT21_020072 [Puccinia graminis f. sp. tritici]KAA1075532.1 hypothetical protein PGTUg99_022726 [Puccinia graminis f. sp. tritici]
MTKISLEYFILITSLFGSPGTTTSALPNCRLQPRSFFDEALAGSQKLFTDQPSPRNSGVTNVIGEEDSSEGFLPSGSSDMQEALSSFKQARDKIFDSDSDEVPMSKKRKTSWPQMEKFTTSHHSETNGHQRGHLIHQEPDLGVLSAVDAFALSLRLAASQNDEEKMAKFSEQALDFMGYQLAWAFDNGSTQESLEELKQALTQQIDFSSNIPAGHWLTLFDNLIKQLHKEPRRDQYLHVTYARLSVDNNPPHFRCASVHYLPSHSSNLLELIGFRDVTWEPEEGEISPKEENKDFSLLNFLARNGSKDLMSIQQPRGVFRISQWNSLKEMAPEIITHGKLFVWMKAISEEIKDIKDQDPRMYKILIYLEGIYRTLSEHLVESNHDLKLISPKGSQDGLEAIEKKKSTSPADREEEINPDFQLNTRIRKTREIIYFAAKHLNKLSGLHNLEEELDSMLDTYKVSRKKLY